MIEAAQDCLDNQFDALRYSRPVERGGNVDYHWIKRLGESRAVSIGISLALVWLMAGLSFRSPVAGTTR